MVNSSDFIERLEQLLQYYDLNASAFADKIQVQRSNISHLMSGRNKPSLEFVLKVVKQFPEVNLYWLLNGRGSFPAENNKEDTSGNREAVTEVSSEVASGIGEVPSPESDTFKQLENSSDILSDTNSKNIRDESVVRSSLTSSAQNGIARIVIFYDDGSFESFSNR